MPPVDHTDAPVVGYTDRLSARPGERITVHASATEPDVRVRVLRVDHDGVAPVRTPVDLPVPDRISVPHQRFDLGSYGIVADPPPFTTAAVWVWPTAFGGVVLSRGGLRLGLRGDGRAELRAGGTTLTSSVPLELRRWHLLVAGHHPAHGALLAVDTAVDVTGPGSAPDDTGPLLLAAALDPAGRTTDHFDGKLDSPALFDRLLSPDEVARLAGGGGPLDLGPSACWDLAQDITGHRMLDLVSGRHGELRNGPLRAVTGHDWAGDVLDWRHARRGYGAVHFHSDDLADCGWDPVLTLDLPADLPGGCYAVELASAAGVDRLPFFVRPPAGARTAPLALLVPTLSYLAYALDHLFQPFLPEDPAEVAARFARANTLHSLYDRHTDGSGAATASLHRPLLGMRDDHVFRYTRGPHQYSEDLHLVGWLGRQGIPFDLLTDHDLHAEGPAALAGYRAVITGSHPEYWTGTMLDAVEGHVAAGGRLGYLGGNGAYWVTAIRPDAPHLAELRRGYAGVRTWECEPGELHLAATGEPGGLWAERGRAPHRLFGIGTTAAGMTSGGAYRIVAEPGDPDVDRVLDGVDRTAPLGDFGAVLGGAASFETDGIDPLPGSPPGTTLIARAMLGDQYLSGDTGPAIPHPHADPVDRRRADLTLLRAPGGGVVFATGSIGWCGALSHDGDDNAVSRITANVLRWFTAPAEPPSGEDTP